MAAEPAQHASTPAERADAAAAWVAYERRRRLRADLEDRCQELIDRWAREDAADLEDAGDG